MCCSIQGGWTSRWNDAPNLSYLPSLPHHTPASPGLLLHLHLSVPDHFPLLSHPCPPVPQPILRLPKTYLPYHDLFPETWAAFSRYPLKRISDYADKRVGALGCTAHYLCICTYAQSCLLHVVLMECLDSDVCGIRCVRIAQVCFRDVVFPLLPRMRGGLYYNTYIVSPRHCMRACMFS